MASDNELKNFHDSVTSFMETGGTGGGLSALPIAGVSTLGAVKVGAGLSMAGDMLTVTLAGGAVLSSVESSLNGAMWYVV